MKRRCTNNKENEFKEENIFIATIDKNGNEEVDIFHKNKDGYTRFMMNGCETFMGDNSDGKGKLKYIVPILDYFKTDELFQLTFKGAYNVIGIFTTDPIENYKRDYIYL